ncbi:MAG: MBL fold metallo-hydrolase [Chloroflexota bacterium]
MEVRIVGAHQCETVDRHFTTILVDGALAIDAGSLAGGLTLDRQLHVTDVLLTHRHWDHVKDLAGYGYNLFCGDQTATVYCTNEVQQAVSDYLLNPHSWMDFFHGPDPAHPVYRHRPVDPGTRFTVGAYQVLSVPVNHSVPATGYQIGDAAGRAVYYTSDNGPGCGQFWLAARPDVLMTECTYSNVEAVDAARHGHLYPSALEEALVTFRDGAGYLPRVILVHVNPFFEERIAIEVAEVARRLNATIELGSEGMVVSV